MTVSKNRKQSSLEGKGKEVRNPKGTASRRSEATRVSTILDVRAVGKKTVKASRKRKETDGGVKKDATRVSTIIEVRGAGKKKAAGSARPKSAKSGKAKPARTRVSTILDVRAAGKKKAATRRTNRTRDGK